MALHWRPVGPEPASTYWQRRAVVATGAVLFLALLTTLLTGGSDDPDTLAEAPRPSPTGEASPAGAPSPSPTGSATPTPSPSAVPVCPAEVLQIEADAEQASYPVGATPRLSLSVTNTGSTPCSRDLGQAAVELLVYSGKDRIWSSDDCAPGGSADVTTLEPGEPKVQRVTWNGRRSSPGCEGGRAQAQPGTYRVHARVGQSRVEDGIFRITG